MTVPFGVATTKPFVSATGSNPLYTSCCSIDDVAPWKSTISIVRRSSCGGMCTSSDRATPSTVSACRVVPAEYAGDGVHAVDVCVAVVDEVPATPVEPVVVVDRVVEVDGGGVTVLAFELHATQERAPERRDRDCDAPHDQGV